jgi:hypothetical protein
MEEDEEFVAQLGQAMVAQCRKAGMGEVRFLPQGSKKKAHYEVHVYQAGEDGKFQFNEEAGVIGGVGAGVVSGAVLKSVPTGMVVGGLAGLVFSWVMGEKTDVHSFSGICRQRTALAGFKESEVFKPNTGQGLEIFDKAVWSRQTNSFEFPFAFSIGVTSFTMQSKSSRDAEARAVFLRRFPKHVTGGTGIGG